MVCRKANQHAKTIKMVKDDIAEKDRQLWKAELKQQAYSVYDDMLYSAEEITNNEVAQLKTLCNIPKRFILEQDKHEDDSEYD